MVKSNALAPFVAGVPSAADLAVEGGAVKFSMRVLPYIEQALASDDPEIRKMATCINGADSVHGAKDWDKVEFTKIIAEMAAKDEWFIDRTDLPRIERILQAHLRKSGNSRSQRRAEARARRDAQNTTFDV